MAFHGRFLYNGGITKEGEKQLKYTAEKLKDLSKEEIIALTLSMQEKAEEQDRRLRFLTEQVEILKNYRFGRKTEKLPDVPDGQMSISDLFNEAEMLADKSFILPEPEAEEVLPEEIVRRKRKKKGHRSESLKDLEAEDIDHRIPEEELREIFPEGYKELPTEDYLRLKFIPARFIAERHHVHVYAGRKEDMIVRAERPADLLRNSIVTPSLEAAVINAKYVNAIPYDRLSKEFSRCGVRISSTNMAGWTIKCAERYLSGLYEAFKEELLKHPVIQADETPVEVAKDGRPAGTKSWMWVYRTGERDRDQTIVLYDYWKTRNASHPREFLEGYKGICVTDGYQVYHTLEKEKEDLRVAGCWAHARRKFADAVKALGKGNASGSVAHQALKLIAAIYKADNELVGRSAEEILEGRQKNVAPLVDAFFAWASLKTGSVSAQSETGKGLSYCLNQERYLRVFLGEPDVPPDNNASERAIRPFCVGKHNWHVIDTVRGAKASAVIYSIVETAKANNLKPYEYCSFLLTELSRIPEELREGSLAGLMPWSSQIPENCIVKK